jgi:phospholipase C
VLFLTFASRFARRNFVDHSVTDQLSVLRFIEDTFDLGRIDPAPGKSVAEGGSFDQIAGSLSAMFDFDRSQDDNGRRVILDVATGQPTH